MDCYAERESLAASDEHRKWFENKHARIRVRGTLRKYTLATL